MPCPTSIRSPLMMVMVMWLMRPTMMKVMLAIFPFWESSENVRDETFVCRSCFEWQVVTMTKVSQNWQNGRQFYRKSWQFRHKKTIKLSTELWSGFVVLFSEVSIQQLQSLTGDQTEINADFQQTEGNSFIREKNNRYCDWSNQNFGNLHSLESITSSQNFQIEYFDENIDDSLKTMTKSWLR